jgi:hypothetical protein
VADNASRPMQTPDKMGERKALNMVALLKKQTNAITT